MKKIIIVIISLFIVSNANAITASSYIVYNMSSDEILLGDNIHFPRLIASVSKILTCIIAIENGNLQKKIKIDIDSLKVTGSSLYLSINEEISLKDLLYGLMLRSGNDAAVAISKEIAGSMENFAELMNIYAKKIGMNDSTFYNAHGLELNNGLGNISSAYDLALLTKYAMNNELFKEIFKTKNYVCKTNLKTYHWLNKNKLLKYEYVTGGKTGYTLKAKRTLVTTSNILNQDIVIVTLNDSNDFNDHHNIYEYLLKNYELYKIIDKNKNAKELNNLNIGCFEIKNDYHKFINKKDIDNLKIEYHLDQNNSFIYVLNNDSIIYKERIYTCTYNSAKWYQKLYQRLINLFR